MLVDAGPPEADLAGDLEQRGIDRLAALIITHPDSDHAGGAARGARLARRLPPAVRTTAAAPSLAQADAAGIPTRRLSTGGVLRSGRLRLRVLWPPGSPRSTAALPSSRTCARWSSWRAGGDSGCC